MEIYTKKKNHWIYDEIVLNEILIFTDFFNFRVCIAFLSHVTRGMTLK